MSKFLAARSRIAVLIICAAATILAPIRAAADPSCVSDIRNAGPDGSFCHGSATPPTDAASASGSSNGASLAGAVGSALGAALVRPLPPVKDFGMRRIKVTAEDEGLEDSSIGTGVETAQDIIKNLGPGVGAKGKRPLPASKLQVKATIAELTPFVTFNRTDMDRLNPLYKHCESGCGCHGRCTPDCSGTCYAYGQKDPRPDGNGVDCSGLIAQENPEFWSGAGKSSAEECRLDDPNKCDYGTQQQLSLLKAEGKDDISNAEDLQAGDVAYFNSKNDDGSQGRVDHVMQLTSTPSCSTDGGHQTCLVYVIQAPHTGVAVQRNQLTLVDGHVVEKDGIVVNSDLYFYAGGTPPPGQLTGGSNQ